MNGDGLGCVRSGESGHDHAQIARIAEIDFADMIGGAGTDEVGIPHELLKSLHALLALGSRHGSGEASDNWEMEVVTARAIEDDAEFVDESKVAAVANEGDGCALGNVDANVIRQDALHAGGPHPGDLFRFPAGG